ncbi:NAD(P)H-dependent oxidoreductase [Emcibacter nanhaiensis]|uniref:NAD(P)H-dependent oxidoreductase n=1 Tax=Emcibacter nanhaiensis TaxID=1505037 RepID=A0A501PSU0_9PROT|nr:NAD(P)H-dependent oxidoreductase [Emcibacter nanhaiensis]TPD63167.1 NAD(P)H-dependent oxidoreductase [Emcibacter nanhaiensis]
MPRNILIIDGHPDLADHLCHALAEAYGEGARDGGHDVRTLKVSTLDFPILQSMEDYYHGAPCPAIHTAQKDIDWADHIVLIFPLWLGGLPALFKGFLEQTLRPGFAYESKEGGWPVKKLKDKSARIVVTMGMPAFAYRWFFMAHSLKNLKRNILKFCGISPVRDTLFGMVEAVSDDKRKGWIEKMREMGRGGE